MEQGHGQSANLWFPGAVVASLVAAGYLLNQPALQTARPTDSDRWSQESTGHQDVEARLWQDPFFAVDRHIKEIDSLKDTSERTRIDEDKDVHTPAHLREKLKTRIEHARRRPGTDSGNPSADKASAPLVLVVTAPGAPYSEQAERRRRVRYAVLSGLFAVGYAPEDEEHVGFFRPTRPVPCVSDASSVDVRFPKVVPYEFVVVDRLTKWDGSKRPWIMLVWLDNEALDDHPLSVIKTILGEIHPSNGAKIEYQVIGPSTSGALIKLAREVYEESSHVSETCLKASAAAWGRELTIWSPWASASERELCAAYRDFKSCAAQPTTVEQLFDDRPDVKLTRLTPDNDVLVENLLRELKLRGVDPVGAARHYRDHLENTIYTGIERVSERKVLRSHPLWTESTDVNSRGMFKSLLNGITPAPRLQRHRLLIISEFDTPYQRSLLQSFRRIVLEGCVGPRRSDNDCPAQKNSFNWIYRFSYLRGVDGQVPATKDPPSDRDQKEKRGSHDQGPPERHYENPFGNGQFDYIRRLADRIEAEEAGLEAGDQSGFGAIGVLGMDTYDKLTVLQALTARFPGRIFFTTGHDARYLDPQESKWARNLVVVSPFGLELDSKLQRGVPPFRDAYQTATFLATLVAIDPENPARKREFIQQKKENEACATGLGPSTGCYQQTKGRWLYPLTFEIGRTEAQLFPVPGEHPSNANCGPRKLFSCAEIQSGPPVSLVQPSATQRVPGAIVVVSGFAMLFVLLRFQAPVARWLLALIAASVVTMVWAIFCWNDVLMYLSEHGNGEPPVFLEGISIWPAQLIRGFAFAVAVCALILSYFCLKRNITAIHHTLGWKPGQSCDASAGPARAPAPSSADVADSASSSPAVPLTRPAPCFLQGSADYGDALHLWRCCGARRERWRRVVRVLVLAALYFALGFCLTLVWPVEVPSRGRFGYEINFCVMMIAICAYSFLLAYVLDVFQSCIWFIRALYSGKLALPGDLIATTAAKLNLAAEHVEEWLAIRVISQRTEAVGKLIYGPFAVLFIVVLARSSIFEHWVWPPSLLLIIGISVLMLIYAAVSLRMETERARRKALERLRSLHIREQGSNEKVANQLDSMIKEIQELRKGAFAPYTDQPFLKAPLILVAGYAGNLLIEYMAVPVH